MTPRDPEPPTDVLVQRTLQGDLAPFGRLYARIAPALYTWANLRIPRHLRSALEPEELVQEVWCRALDRIGSFDPTRSFRYWVFKIASNTLLESLRRAARGRTADDARGVSDRDPAQVPAAVTSVSGRLARDEAIRGLLDEVRTWSEEDRRLLLYRGLEGLPHGEVAERLGIAADAAGKRWQRLRQRLRDRALPPELLADG